MEKLHQLRSNPDFDEAADLAQDREVRQIVFIDAPSDLGWEKMAG